jgi:hypothetical protein
MLRLMRQITPKLRPWLMAMAAVLLLSSVLEAGHGHGVFVPKDDTCAICQQVIGLDKTLLNTLAPILVLLVAVLTQIVSLSASPSITTPFTHIRAPPAQLLSR